MKKFVSGFLTLVVAGAAASLMFVQGGFVHAEIASPPEIGVPVADFKLKGTDGKEYALSADKGKIVVISFTSMHCPYSLAAEPVYARSAEKYADKGVVFYSVDSHASTTTAELVKYAASENETEAKLPYPILKDVDNKYADALGAKRTPEIYVVDKDGKLAYHGAIDNQKPATDSSYKNYVDAAIDDLIAGKPVAEPKHSAFGCGIKRKVS